MATSDKEISVQTQWLIDGSQVPTTFNQVMVQDGAQVQPDGKPDGCFLTLGHVSPPVLPPNLSPEQLSDFAAVNVLPIAVVGRYFLSIDRARELRDVLCEFLVHAEATNE